MSGIVGSRLNIRGSGVVGSLGTDGQLLTSAGAGQEIVFESAGTAAVTALNNATQSELVSVGSTTTELDAEANLTFTGSALTCIGTITVGVDNTGHDVKYFGATSGNYWLWDESADGVVQIGTLTVGVNDAGHDVKYFGATAGSYWLWDESADGVVQIGTLTVGVDDAGHDVKLFGNAAGAYMEWDASADELRIMGASADATTSTGKLLLATSLTDINANDVIGKIDFQAPHEAGGTDAITVAASIRAIAQATFSSSVNATDLIFYTGHSEAAAEKIRFTSQNEIGIGGANYGTDGQVLTSGGAGAAVAWEDAGGAVTALNNATQSELVTVGSTTTELDAEANLTFTGSALTCIGTITVGVDNTGHDVKYFGATSGSFLLWDESADALLLTDSTPIQIGDAQDLTLYHDGSNSYITNKTGALKIATETSGIALTIGHTTSETTVADNLTVTGTTTITGSLEVNNQVTINEGSADVDFRVESNTKTHMLTVDGGNNLVGIGHADAMPDHGVGLHIKTADAGALTVSTGADELVLENGTSEAGCGISIISATDAEGMIHFGDSGDTDIGRIVYNHTNNYMYLTAGANEGLRVDSAGHVTMPDQPAFCCSLSVDREDVTGAGTTYVVIFNQEHMDRNADYVLTTNVFTAPVSGIYHFSSALVVSGIATDQAYSRCNIEHRTSNRVYYQQMLGNIDDNEYGNVVNVGANIIAEMDANDTHDFTFRVDGNSDAVNVHNGSTCGGYLVS